MVPSVRWRPKKWAWSEAPVAVILPEPLAGEVRALLREDKRVEAVRLVRERTHLNLLPAVLAVDLAGQGGD
jgi:hypothetical protein